MPGSQPPASAAPPGLHGYPFDAHRRISTGCRWHRARARTTARCCRSAAPSSTPTSASATDSALAERVALEAAGPLGRAGVPGARATAITPGFTAYPGTVTLSEASFARVVEEILDGIRRVGFRRHPDREQARREHAAPRAGGALDRSARPELGRSCTTGGRARAPAAKVQAASTPSRLARVRGWRASLDAAWPGGPTPDGGKPMVDPRAPAQTRAGRDAGVARRRELRRPLSARRRRHWTALWGGRRSARRVRVLEQGW